MVIQLKQSRLIGFRPQKIDLLFLRHFFLKTNARGRNFFYCVRLFFSCFSVDRNVKECVIAYTLPLITTFFENRKMKYSSNVLLSPAYEIGRGILKWRCPSVRPSVRPSFRPSVRPSVRHLRFLSN